MRHGLMLLLVSALAVQVQAAGSVVLFSNGPIVNLPGAGAGGAHASRVQGELGLVSLGLGVTFTTPSNTAWVEIADDFEITTPGGWQVSSITLELIPPPTFGDTGCTGPAAGTYRMYLHAGPPWAGSEILAPSGSVGSRPPSGVYRVPSSDAANQSCPVSHVTVPVGVHLDPGTYWVAWEFYGTIGNTPGAVPVTRAGQASTGNGASRLWTCQPFGPCSPGAWLDLLDAGGASQGLAFEVRGTPESVVKGNFDGRNGADLVLRNVDPASGNFNRNKVWLMNGPNRSSEGFVAPDPVGPTWHVVGSDDFDSWSAPGQGPDGHADLALYDDATGEVRFWLLDGLQRVGPERPLTGAAALPLEWKLAATGDFDADDRPDLLWRNTATQKLVIWTMQGTARTGTLVPVPDQAVHANWQVVAALDYSDDGARDLLWYNTTTGKLVTWYMDAAVQRTSGQFVSPPNAGDNNWRVLAGGDYSQALLPQTPPLNSPDIVWRNETSGNQVVWHLDFASTRVYGEFTNPPASAEPQSWTIVAPR